MDMRIIRDIETLTELEPEWLDLYRRSPDATPFQSPMWLLPWWRAVGSGGLCAVTTADAFAPLYVVRDEDESLGMFVGTGISDYLDILGTDASAVMADLA